MPKLDQLVDQRITAVLGRFWTSSSAENADYLYRLGSGRYFRFPEIFKCVTHFEYCQPSGEHTLCFDATSDDALLHQGLFNANITDMLVPQEPAQRCPDNFFVKLTFGLYLFQESGAPIGCPTRCYLTDPPDAGSPLMSVFETQEWRELDA